MNVKCDDCDLEFDDTYRLTYCPHDTFQMSTLLMRADGSTTVLTSLSQWYAELAGRLKADEVITDGPRGTGSKSR